MLTNKTINIDGVDYPNYEQKEPEGYISKSNMNESKFYDKILPKHYSFILKDTLCYYKYNEMTRSGNMIKYIEPSIFVFKNDSKMCIWSVNLEGVDIFIRDQSIVKKEKRMKDNLYQLWINGFIKILDEPDPKFDGSENKYL